MNLPVSNLKCTPDLAYNNEHSVENTSELPVNTVNRILKDKNEDILDNQWQKIPIDIVSENVNIEQYIESQFMYNLSACDISNDEAYLNDLEMKETDADPLTTGLFKNFL